MAAFFRIIRILVACALLLLGAVLLMPAIEDIREWPVAALGTAPAWLIAALMLRGIWRERKREAQADDDYREVTVLRLAAAEGGVLTATRVASRLGWPMEMALATLRAVEEAGPVSSTVTDQGVLVFEFREIIHDPRRSRAAPEAVSAPAEERTH